MGVRKVSNSKSGLQDHSRVLAMVPGVLLVDVKMLNANSLMFGFLANVNVLRYVCYMRSQFRLSSVCLSVCRL